MVFRTSASLFHVFPSASSLVTVTCRPEDRAGQMPEEYLVQPRVAERSVLYIIRSVSCNLSSCCSGNTCAVGERLAAVLSSGSLAPFVDTELNFQVHHCQELMRLEEIHETREEAAWKEH